MGTRVQSHYFPSCILWGIYSGGVNSWGIYSGVIYSWSYLFLGYLFMELFIHGGVYSGVIYSGGVFSGGVYSGGIYSELFIPGVFIHGTKHHIKTIWKIENNFNRIARNFFTFIQHLFSQQFFKQWHRGYFALSLNIEDLKSDA